MEEYMVRHSSVSLSVITFSTQNILELYFGRWKVIFWLIIGALFIVTVAFHFNLTFSVLSALNPSRQTVPQWFRCYKRSSRVAGTLLVGVGQKWGERAFHHKKGKHRRRNRGAWGPPGPAFPRFEGGPPPQCPTFNGINTFDQFRPPPSVKFASFRPLWQSNNKIQYFIW